MTEQTTGNADDLVRLVAEGRSLREIADRPGFGSAWWLGFTLMHDSSPRLFASSARAAP